MKNEKKEKKRKKHTFGWQKFLLLLAIYKHLLLFSPPLVRLGYDVPQEEKRKREKKHDEMKEKTHRWLPMNLLCSC
jgi:hypothetical protein